MMNKKRTAIHEAGHFVAYWRLKLRYEVYYITIQETPSYFGTLFSSGLSSLNNLNATDICNQIIFLYAGCAAETLFYPDHAENIKVGSQQDEVNADTFLRQLTDSDDVRATIRRELRQRAHVLVEENQGAIEALGNELIQYNKLYFDHAELVVNVIDGKVPLQDLENHRRLIDNGWITTE